MKKTLLWILAFLLMVCAAAYQRRTGPTHPLRGELTIAGQVFRYKLTRSGLTSHDASVVLPNPGTDTSAVLNFKRFRTSDPFTAVPMKAGEEGLVGFLPAQPAAGKLEYFVEVSSPGGTLRIPESAEENIIIRFKDDVPLGFLIPHIVIMFFSVLIGIRTALSALSGHEDMRTLGWITLGGMTVGGMMLGPIVQKYAFGAFWTGFPYGYDLTDNKMLIMWLCWIGVCLTILWSKRRRSMTERAVVVLASLVMIVVYLVPHSMRGSELDYSKLDRGIPASEAIKTGK